MIRPAFREAALRRPLATLWIIWGAMAFAVLFYVAIAVQLTRTMGRVAPSDVAATLTPALYAVAVATALLTVWWRRFLAPERLVAAAGAAPALTVKVGAVPETDAERRALVALTRLQTQSVTVWAMAESLAVYGLVLSIVTGDAGHAIGLAAATLLLLGVHAPSRGRLEAVLSAVPSP